MRSQESSNPVAAMGMGLDLSKAKEIQNQMLNQQDKATKKPGFNLAIPGFADSNKMDVLANRSASNSNEGEELDLNLPEAQQVEQSTGPQLQINIKNVAKLKDDVEMKQEEDEYEPPRHKRGCPQPDQPPVDPSQITEDPMDDMMMKNTSVAEIRNNKFKQICSEIIPSFLYLGSDFLAKDKDILMSNGI